MDVIGHCATAAQSGLFTEEDVFGAGVIDLMFLNYAHCHDWAYQRCWEAGRLGRDEHAVRLFRAHMIGDWVIHYGAGDTRVKVKRGWAYRRMLPARHAAGRFVAGARERGVWLGRHPLPDAWTRKQKHDFWHTLTEMAFDLVIADEVIDRERLRTMKRAFARLAAPGDPARGRVLARFDRLRVTTDKARAVVAAEIQRLGRLGHTAREPADFPVATVCHKYGIADTPAGRAHVRALLDDLAGHLDAADVRAQCRLIAAAIRAPETLYTGALEPGGARG